MLGSPTPKRMGILADNYNKNMKPIEQIRIERIKKWLKGSPQPPVHAELNPTGRCNLKCKFCLQWAHGDTAGELSQSEWVKAARELVELGIKSCLISGGEPFCKPEVTLPLMEELKKSGVEGNLVTNGTLINDKAARFLIESQWENVVISVDSANPKTHDYLRGKEGTFKRVVENIQLINKLKQLKGSSKPNLAFDFVLTNKNFKDAPSVIRLASRLKCMGCTFLTLINYNQEVSKLNIGNSQLSEAYGILKDAKALADKLGIQTNLGVITNNSILDSSKNIKAVVEKNFEISNKVPICLQPFITIFINERGVAEPCPSSTDFGVDIREHPIKKVWLSKNFNDLREMVLKRNLPDFCSRCCLPKAIDSREFSSAYEKSLRL